jgi:hypothetical protein
MIDRPHDPFARHPTQTRERIRLQYALTEIATTRLTGRFQSLEEVVGELGYPSVGDFWDAALTKRMPAANFAHLLKSFYLTPALNSPEEQNFDLSIEHALLLGFEANEPWAVHHRDKNFVKPREAALWLLSQPTERALVPDELREFLEGKKKTSATRPRIVGAPDKYDWGAVKIVLMEKCKSQGGVPHANYPDIDWRRQSHAIQHVRERMKKEWGDREPVDSTLKVRVAQFLGEIETELADN